MEGLGTQYELEENILKVGVTILFTCSLGVWVVTGLIYSFLLTFSLHGK